jgi:hypothetical protein
MVLKLLKYMLIMYSSQILEDMNFNLVMIVHPV